MNLYHCMIELRQDCRALAFAKAVDGWMQHLQTRGLITGWRLMRRKFGLASGAHPDFLLEIDVPGMAALDDAFAALAAADDDAGRRYDLMHQMIASVEVGLYRPYPDTSQRERIALV
ncbi:MAG: DUF6614 family protein [Pseudotabrizicola sp.]|uniref:DUF6614 family protein n=1 Tax=Pseudotabrizicola sp. TaxID=2939647 RepID=UPI002722527A|nr:DUF6614 family protein [Pseudotabrizicola sp.]MDO8882553.1 hypothetical protein [Pseudotabrizicola sp.]MDP2079821.1 hypothetical protein [Pseudotabrizicola sp.]MDZ7574822.1 DUF6614 family protein [Pseudotabrizicola sp.]